MITALVDADIITYVYGFACESISYECEDGVVLSTMTQATEYCETYGLEEDLIRPIVEHEPFSHVLFLIRKALRRIKDRTGCDDMRLFLSGDSNFRDKIATIKPYKGGRAKRKPHWYNEIREHLIDVRGAEVCVNMEADDAMGILANENTVICTIDKDLDMVPGLHYNFKTDKLFNVSEHEAIKNFYKQLLTGDRVDNIQGIPGIGKVTANKLINPCSTEEDMYWTCLNEYCKAYDKAYAALKENADLLWILRVDGKMWEPPV